MMHWRFRGSARQASQFPSQRDGNFPLCDESMSSSSPPSNGHVGTSTQLQKFLPLWSLLYGTLPGDSINCPLSRHGLCLMLLPQTWRHRLGLTAGTQGAKSLHLNHFGMPSFPLLRGPKGPNAVVAVEERRPFFFPFSCFCFSFSTL